MSTVTTLTPLETATLIFERLNERNADFLLEVAARDEHSTWPVIGELHTGEALRDHFASIFASLPDFQIQVERTATDGETVFVHWHATGTFIGEPFLGIKPTGHPIDIRGIDCMTIRAGRVVENFIAYDGVTFAVQAGVLPAHGSHLDHVMIAGANLKTFATKKLHA